MAKVIDFRTRREVVDTGKIVGMSRASAGVHMWKDQGRVRCPYCHALLEIPPKLNASFTCRGGEHYHMFTKEKLEVKA